MPAHRLFTGPFAALEPRFFAAVDDERAGDPLHRVDVLCGSNLLAVYLRRGYAERRGAVANLRFLTFLDLAKERIASPDARPPLPPLGDEVLASRILRETPEAAAFGPLRARPSLARSLVGTADDLREAGFDAKEFRSLVPAIAATEDRRLFLAAIAATLVPFENGRARFFDDHALFARAMEASAPASREPLLVYGTYDLGGVREALLRRVAEERPILAFVPDDPAIETTEAPGIPAVRRPLFERILGTRAEAVSGGGARPRVSRVLASTENVEAREVVREALRAAESGIPLHRIAVLLRDPRLQEPAIAAELRLARLPFYSPAGPRGSKGPAGLLARLLVDPEPPHRLAAARDEEEAAGLLDALGVPKGATIARPPSTPATFGEWGLRLRSAFDFALGSRPERTVLDAAAAALSRLEEVDPSPVAVQEIAALLPRALDLEPEPVGRFERDGLSILSCVSARGLLFDAVLVPGLKERSFPKPGRPDPLLFDEERVALSRKTGRPLPARSGARHFAEERFLFALTRGAARRHLVLLSPRYDAEKGRLLAPSPFFLEEEPKALDAASETRTTPLGAITRDGPAISRHERLRRRLAGGAATPEILKAEPALADAVARADARRRPFFSPYEGRVSLETKDVLTRRAVTATQLERLATCAYRFFWRDLVALRSPDPPPSLALDPRTIGSLVHDVLRDVAKELVSKEKGFSALSPDEAKALVHELSRAAARRCFAEGLPGAPVAFVDIAAERVAAVAGRAVEHERTRGEAHKVQAAESPFGDEEPVLLVAGDLTLKLRGRIDRLDRAGSEARVVDYKTGKSKPFGRKNKNHRVVAGGEKLQLPVYALAAQARGASEVASEYLFVDEE
ncbi:MAG TPA: PD-(D/E)XK nuclease family protein, partial [Thermoanaerobaculia bacterium]|nr:PD-(D/E)XK nuclease family protein [Thermoanaerobaculia bacterium]